MPNLFRKKKKKNSRNSKKSKCLNILRQTTESLFVLVCLCVLNNNEYVLEVNLYIY